MDVDNKLIQQNIQKIEEIMKILNFSDKEIKKQTKDLGEVLLMAIIAKVFEGKDNQIIKETFGKENLNEEEIKKFLENNYSKEELQNLIKEELTKIIAEYFGIILKGTSEEKLLAIEKVLEETPSSILSED
jgi:hypothetical protein